MGYQPEPRTSPGKASGRPPSLPFASQVPAGLRELQEKPSFSRRDDIERLTRQIETASRLGHDFAKLPVSSGHRNDRAMEPGRAPLPTSPIQRTARSKHFRSGRTKFASRRNGTIGSVYAQNSSGSHNRGHRIRLEHRSGPHLSRRRSYRHSRVHGVQTLLPGGAIGGLGSGRLVETRTRAGRVRHTSRGTLGDMAPLSDRQARKLFKLAQRSDADRANIGPGRTHANKAAHAEVHNQRMRVLLRRGLFAGHELGIGQAARDLLPGAPIP